MLRTTSKEEILTGAVIRDYGSWSWECTKDQKLIHKIARTIGDGLHRPYPIVCPIFCILVSQISGSKHKEPTSQGKMIRCYLVSRLRHNTFAKLWLPIFSRDVLYFGICLHAVTTNDVINFLIPRESGRRPSERSKVYKLVGIYRAGTRWGSRADRISGYLSIFRRCLQLPSNKTKSWPLTMAWHSSLFRSADIFSHHLWAIVCYWFFS